MGLGVLLGDPTGGTAKYWLTEKQALDFGVGVSQNMVLVADYIYHGWNALPQSKRGRLAAYISGGVRLETSNDTDFGLRTMIGLSYWPKFKRPTPVEFFLELGPVYRLTPDAVRVRMDGGFGLRYYFEKAVK